MLERLERRVASREATITALAERITALERRHAELRARVTKLERARDRWRTKATDRRLACRNLRLEVRRVKAGRELWKHRALRDA